MKTHQHRHRSKGEEKIVGFSHCAAPGRCYAASHGGICRVATCSCGATRRTNSTGPGREERGEWQE